MRRFLVSQAVTVLADSVLMVALAIWVKQLTGSTSAATLVILALLVPIALSPLAGLLVDRVRRRPLLLVTDLLTAALVLLLVLVDADRVWLVHLVAFGYGCSAAVLAAAQSALLPVLAPEPDDLVRVSGRLMLLRKALELLGPLAGAALLSFAGGTAVAVVDAVVFAVAAGLLASVPVAEPHPALRAEPWLRELSAGVVQVRRVPLLGRLLVAVATGLLVVGFLTPVEFAVVDDLGRAPTLVGVLGGCFGGGAILGGLAGAPLLRRAGARWCAGTGLLLIAADLALLAVPSFPVLLASAVVGGAGVPLVVLALMTTAQLNTPAGLMGRVAAVVQSATSVPQIASAALGAVLIAVVPYRLLIGAGVLVLVAAATWLVRPGRKGAASGPDPFVPAARSGAGAQ